MEYGPSDSSGTDDDLPQSHQNRGVRGDRVTGNGRSGVGSLPYSRVSNDMESQIHRLEQEAYSSVLRAFQAQSDAITWEKESLMSELRKELRVSNEEHRELLTRVNADDIIKRIREWRQGGGFRSGLENTPLVHESVPSPTVSASRKRQKNVQLTSHPMPVPSPALLQQPITASMHLFSSAAKHGGLSSAKGKKTKPSHQYPSGANREITEAPTGNHFIGKKVMTRWPADNNFYEAVITEYNILEDRHALVYDIHTKNETWEWVNLKEIAPQDIRWPGEDVGIPNQVILSGAGRGVKKSMGRGGSIVGAGRGRGGALKAQPRNDYMPFQNGDGKKLENIEIVLTETIVREAERICSASHSDPSEIERAMKMLKDQEQSLVDAITRLADVSDGESGMVAC